MSTPEDIKIVIRPSANADSSAMAPLYLQYPGQHAPQRAYMEIDPEARRVSWDVTGEVGNAIPVRVYHRTVRRYAVTPYLLHEQIADLTERLRPQIERVIDGLTVDWDGNNYVGRLSQDAQDAEGEIQAALHDAEFDTDTDLSRCIIDESEED